MNNQITLLDIVLMPLYLAFIMGVGYSFSKKLSKSIRGYFIKGLALKLLCGLGFAWVFVYYYGGGDTRMYFQGASIIFNDITSGNGLRSLYENSMLPYGSKATLFTQRFAGIVNLFAFNSFWICTLLFASLTFIGQWLLFLAFYKQFPTLHKQLAISCLFIPGVIFWSSGIMKDSICMLFIGVLVYGIQNIFLFNKKKVFSIILVALGFYIVIKIKAYIALALIVAITLYAILALKGRIKNTSVRILILPILILVFAGVAFFFIRSIGESLQRYSLDNLLETAQTYQGYHERTSVAGRGRTGVRTGSGYTLGEINFNDPASILGKFPLAVNVTFFRPYIWEVKNPVMLLSALESTFILFFTLRVMRRTGLKKFFSVLFNKKEALFCFTFALIFGFAVGFTTYNFGSLVRYKTPCIPFFLVGLVLINHFAVKKRKTLHATKSSSQPHLKFHTT